MKLSDECTINRNVIEKDMHQESMKGSVELFHSKKYPPISADDTKGKSIKLVLVRHGESQWNRENLFTGWTDVELTESGVKEAKNAGMLLEKEDFDFDICYTSYLKRAIHTLNIILEQLDREWLPVIKTWKLNERHYGALQGLNKLETAQKYGEAQVKIWRRSFDVRPPAITEEDIRNPRLQDKYRNVDPEMLPLRESLKDTFDRVIPYFNSVIRKEMAQGKQVLIAAHGNSIRALVKYLENISEQDIMEVNIPTGIPLVYEFDYKWNIISKYFLGYEKTANQGLTEDAVENVIGLGKGPAAK